MFVDDVKFTNPDNRSEVVALPGNGAAVAVMIYSAMHNAADPQAEADRIRREFAKMPEEKAAPLAPYLEMALTWPAPTKALDVRAKFALVKAIHAKYCALNPLPPLGFEQDTHCRHGVAYNAACADCDKDFA